MQVRIDLDRCIGCGTCEELCPQVFELGDDGFARVVAGDPSAWAACVIEAAESCPQDAIAVDDDRGARVEPTRRSPHNRGLAVTADKGELVP
jgi:ferredoxin